MRVLLQGLFAVWLHSRTGGGLSCKRGVSTGEREIKKRQEGRTRVLVMHLKVQRFKYRASLKSGARW